jgi:hypothetical protein
MSKLRLRDVSVIPWAAVFEARHAKPGLAHRRRDQVDFSEIPSRRYWRPLYRDPYYLTTATTIP